MYNIVELFSGIGSQAKALKNLGVEINTVGTCEWDAQVSVAYDAIHSSSEVPEAYMRLSKEEILGRLSNYVLSNDGKTPMNKTSLNSYSLSALRRFLVSIDRNNNFVDISSLNGSNLPGNIDIMTYSFPCQDLSNVGAFHGYNKGIDPDSGSRSSLLWQVGRILREMQDVGNQLPRFLVMENVPTLLSDRHIDNFNLWIDALDELGYISKYFSLNARHFGIPQNRPRLIMISIYTGEDGNQREKAEAEAEAEAFLSCLTAERITEEYRSSPYYRQFTVQDLLRNDYNNAVLFDEACQCCPNNTVSRKVIWEENPQIVLEGNVFNETQTFVRTITTKQDRHPNSGNLWFDSRIEGRANFRYLTPRECMLFMGFTDEDYEKLVENNPESRKGHLLFPRDKIIRMAGNSIPVKLLEGVFLQLLKYDGLVNGQA